MALRHYTELSDEYLHTEAILSSNWSGTFGDLAIKLGRTSRSALLAVRMVQSYARNHPAWNSSKVYSK